MRTLKFYGGETLKRIWQKWEEDGELDRILILVARWSFDGATEQEIYAKLNVSESIFYKMKREQPLLKQALKKGREVVDSEVVRQLHKESIGYYYKEQSAFKLKKAWYVDGKKHEQEEIGIAEVEKFARPQITAIIFYLVNRLSEQYTRDGLKGGDDDERLQKFKDIMGQLLRPSKVPKDPELLEALNMLGEEE